LRAIEEYCTETGGEISNFEKTGFDFLLLYPKKSGLSKKLKVSILDIRIKQSGLKVSHSLIEIFEATLFFETPKRRKSFQTKYCKRLGFYW